MKRLLAVLMMFIAFIYTACGESARDILPGNGNSAGGDMTAPGTSSQPGGGVSEPLPVTSGEVSVPELPEKEYIYLDTGWEYAGNSVINTGCAVLYRARTERRGVTVAVNAGHGTAGGAGKKTLCHPDGSPKLSGGTTSAGSVYAVAVSAGMTFFDGTPESSVTLRAAELLRDILLCRGYDVLMLRDGADVQLDNVARTVIANNAADCHISLHWDGDGLKYDKGCFCILPVEKLRGMEPVARHWQEHELLGDSLVSALRDSGAKINGSGKMMSDLTQIAYSTVPSVDMELGNAASVHDDTALEALARGLADGVDRFFAK